MKPKKNAKKPKKSGGAAGRTGRSLSRTAPALPEPPERKRRFSSHPLVFFFLFFLLPYLIFVKATWRDWGVSYDEPVVYNGAYQLRHYLSNFHHDPHDDLLGPNFSGFDYFYGAFQTLFIGQNDPLYFGRFHAANLLCASLIFACWFLLLWRQYRNAWVALGGVWALVLTPRFLGNIPSNPKDIPFAVLYFAGLAGVFLTRDWGRFNWRRMLLLGALFGIAGCGRLVGLTLFAALFLFDFYEEWAAPSAGLPNGRVSGGWAGWFGKEALFLFPAFVVSQFCMAALWPYLRVDYFNHFLYALTVAEKFNWSGTTLFMGGGADSHNYPWYYIPVWFLVTIPVSTLAFFFFSLWAFKGRVRDRASTGLYALFFIAFSLIFLMYLVLKPVIYNAERHFTFLMVIVVFLGYLGMVEFFRMKLAGKWKAAAALLLALNAGSVLVQMVRLHPYEYIYFNGLAGGVRGARGRFTMDYFYESMKEAAEWVRDHECTDPNRRYKVMATAHQDCSAPFFSKNMEILPSDYQGKDADYFLMGAIDAEALPEPLKSKVIHTVEREGVPLAYVLKLR